MRCDETTTTLTVWWNVIYVAKKHIISLWKGIGKRKLWSASEYDVFENWGVAQVISITHTQTQTRRLNVRDGKE